jgi:4-amino-4-deoxy-L-arabinose transferase-like glycosyltransferase
MKKKLLGLFFLALALRLAFFGALAWHLNSTDFAYTGGDAANYVELGQRIFAGQGFSSVQNGVLAPEVARLPLVPFLVGLFGPNLLWYIGLQMVISALSVLLLYWLATRIFGETVAIWTALIFAFDPLAIYNSALVLTETWFVFFLLLSVYLLVRYFDYPDRRWLVFSAACLGFSALTRPVALFFPLVVILAITLLFAVPWRRKLVAMVLFLIVFGLVISPWVVRNYDRTGVAGLSAMPAYNLYFYNARVFYAREHQLSSGQAKQIFRTWRQEVVNKLPGPASELALQDFYLQKAVEIISTNPTAYLKFHLLNTAAVFFNTGLDDILIVWQGSAPEINFTDYLSRGPSGALELLQNHPLSVAGKLFVLALYVVVALGWLFSMDRGRKIFGYHVFFLITILFFGLTTGAVAEARFRLPAEPFLILLFVYAMAQIMAGPGKREFEQPLENPPLL